MPCLQTSRSRNQVECAISANVFTCLGLDAGHDTYKGFAKHIIKPDNVDEGRRFALAEAKWIEMFNEQEEGTQELRLKTGKEYVVT